MNIDNNGIKVSKYINRKGEKKYIVHEGGVPLSGISGQTKEEAEKVKERLIKRRIEQSKLSYVNPHYRNVKGRWVYIKGHNRIKR